MAGVISTLCALAAESPRVQVLRRPGKLGLGTAYLAGFRQGLRQGYPHHCIINKEWQRLTRCFPDRLYVEPSLKIRNLSRK